MEGYPLHIAVRDGNVEDVERLIKEGVDVNLVNSSDYTPLFIAAINSHVDVARILLKHGADVRIKRDLGNTALRYTIGFASIDMTNLLLSYNECHFNDVKEYYDYINNRDIYGSTALHAASQFSRIDHVGLLLDAGADKTIKNNNGRIPIDYAKTQEITNLLETHKLAEDVKEPDCL